MENKKISTLIGTVIILAVAVIAFAGILVLEKTQIPEVVEVKNLVLNNSKINYKPVPLSEWKTYTNADWGIEFKYPQTLGTPKIKRIEWSFDNLYFENNDGRIYFLDRITKEDVIKHNEEWKRCNDDWTQNGGDVPCSGYSKLLDNWDKEKKLIEESSFGEIKCANQGKGLGYCERCEIIEVAGIKMLAKYNCANEGGFYGSRIFYRNDSYFSFQTEEDGEYFITRYEINENEFFSTFKFTK